MSYIREKLNYLIEKLKKQNNFDIAFSIEENQEKIITFYKQKLLEIDTKIKIGDYGFSFYNNNLGFFLKDNDGDLVLREKNNLEFFINFDKYIEKKLNEGKEKQEALKEAKEISFKKLSINELEKRIKNYKETMLTQNEQEAKETEKDIKKMEQRIIELGGYRS